MIDTLNEIKLSGRMVQKKKKEKRSVKLIFVKLNLVHILVLLTAVTCKSARKCNHVSVRD